MTSNRVINYFVQWVRENYPRIAVARGSAFYDLFIEAVSIFLNGIYELIDRISQANNLANYDAASESDFDEAAGFWFVDRNEGEYSRTTCRLYLSSPVKVTIPAGFRVSSGDLIFRTDSKYSFGSNQVASQLTGNENYIDFAVVAEDRDESYNVTAGAITSLVDPFYGPWTRITNPIAATGGVSVMTNEEYYNHIDTSISTRAELITADSIIFTLTDLFPTLFGMSVKGFGDDEMQRDLYFGISGHGGHAPYYKSDYQYKLAGQLIPNPNEAYKMSSEVPEPDLEDLQASGVELEDSEYKAISGHDLIYGLFYGARIVADIYDSDIRDYNVEDWIVSDSGMPWGQCKYGNSVYIGVNGLYMGAVPPEESVVVPEE